MASRLPVVNGALRQVWYDQLASLLSDLEDFNEDYLHDSYLPPVGICMSTLNTELGDITDNSDLHVFTPLSHDRLKVSICAIDPPYHRNLSPRVRDDVVCSEYHWGSGLLGIVGQHLKDVGSVYPTRWKRR